MEKGKFCTKCGARLEKGKRCSCSKTSKAQDVIAKMKGLLTKLLQKMGLCNPFDGMFGETNDIIPTYTQKTDDEVTVKQYHIATLRSRIRGQYAKGYLQVTNKRLLFHAPGASYQGQLSLHHEFSIADISGIEIKQNNRVSFFNFFILSCCIPLFIAAISSALFAELHTHTPVLATILSAVFLIASTLPFFLVKKHFWVKLFSLALGYGAVFATGGLFNVTATLVAGVYWNVADIAAILAAPILLLNLILVCLVPDLTLIIKTNSASEAITIRRKQFPTLFKQEVEYSGFGEVLPGKDIDTAVRELGALISDIQTLGDVAVENWKENK